MIMRSMICIYAYNVLEIIQLLFDERCSGAEQKIIKLLDDLNDLGSLR